LRSVAERTLEQREEVLALTRQRVRAGLDTNVELRLSEASLPQTRQAIETLDEQIALQHHALAALSGQPPGALDALMPHLGTVAAIALPEILPADLLGRRADVEAARWRVEAAIGERAVARAEFYPNINLVAFAGFTSIGLDRLLLAGSEGLGVGPAIRLPLFDAGRLRAAYSIKTADLDAAVSAYNAAVLEALRDTADQLASMRAIERQQQEQRAALGASESAYALALQRFHAGLSPYLTVLSAENAVLAERRNSVELKSRALSARAQLARALGGGFESSGS
jgi:NodT family efflux transporter outer membrane factor (OMF) lipoprotein